MSSVHFFGEIVEVLVDTNFTSLTFAVVRGNAAWSLRNGMSSGETQICKLSDYRGSILNHPIDIHFETASPEGCPFFVCEIWDKDEQLLRSLAGCGSVWLPLSPGEHHIDVALWRPSSSNPLEIISGKLLPNCPDLRALRELVVSPYLRSQLQTETVGSIRMQIRTVVSGFDVFGVSS